MLLNQARNFGIFRGSTGLVTFLGKRHLPLDRFVLGEQIVDRFPLLRGQRPPAPGRLRTEDEREQSK